MIWLLVFCVSSSSFTWMTFQCHVTFSGLFLLFTLIAFCVRVSIFTVPWIGRSVSFDIFWSFSLYVNHLYHLNKDLV